MTRATLLCLACLATALLNGCGGGATGVELQSTVRQLGPNSRWSYLVSGTVSDGSIIGPQRVSGTYSIQMTSETVTAPDLQPAKVALVSGKLTGIAYSHIIAERYYYRQQPDGTILLVGGQAGSGNDYWFGEPEIDPYIVVQSPLSVGLNWVVDTKTTLGTTYDDYFTVDGTEKISVPAGGFQTYRVKSDGRAGGTAVISTYWWAPRIGNFVKWTRSTQSGGSTIETLTYKLASYSQ